MNSIRKPFIDSDLVYCRYPDKVENYAKAIGVKRRILTRTMLEDERAFYGQCLNAIQMRLSISNFDEARRGFIITAISDEIYQAGLEDFKNEMKQKKPFLDQQNSAISQYVDRVYNPYKTLAFEPKAFDLAWKRVRYDHEWERNVVESIYNILNRIAVGNTALPKKSGRPVDKEDFVKECTKKICNTRERYREIKGISHTIADTYLDLLLDQINRKVRVLYEEYFPGKHYTPVKLAPTHTSEKRKVVVFTGGIGCGKSELASKWWKANKAAQEGYVVFNTDYTKRALAQRATGDKMYKVQNEEDANEAIQVTHEESAVLTWENCSRYAKQARRSSDKGVAPKLPNLVMETDVLSDKRLEAAMAGGGEVDVHFVSAPISVAENSVELREKCASKRVYSDKIKPSIEAATQNIVVLSRIKHKGTIYMYSRNSIEEAPHYVGAINLQHGEMFIEDLKGFFEIASRSGLGPDDETSKRLFIHEIIENRISINVMGKKIGFTGIEQPIEYRLNSKREFEMKKGDCDRSDEVEELKGYAKIVVRDIRNPVTNYNETNKGIIR